MMPNKNQRKLGDLVKEIASVLGLMIAIFTALEIFLPTSFAQPLGALVSGLVLTALLACVGKWDWGTMLITWLAVGIGLIILYLIVSRPATVMGAVVDSSDSPVVGLTLVLTDSYGVDHRAVTDENGAFEIKNVPEGKFTVLANDELLISRQVPSGWKRILEPVVDVGIPVHKPSPTVVVAITPPNTLTATPVLPTDTPPVPPTLTPGPTPTATLINTPTPTSTPAIPDATVVAPVNLRSGPGIVYDVINTLRPGQVLTVTGRIADATWLQVNTDQMQEGWVINRADLVTLNLPTEGVPIVSTLPPPTAPPTPTQVSFQNFEPDNGTPPGGGNYFWDAWFTTCSFESTIVREGSRAVRVDAHAEAEGNPGDHGGTMGINPSSSDPIDLSSAITLSVWVYDAEGNNTVELKLRDYDDALSNAVWSEMQAEQNKWTEITWSLSDFAGVDLNQIKNIELYEWWDGVYYFDAVSWQ